MIGVGLLTGASSVTTTDEITSPYNMNSFPIALNVRYNTSFMLPFYVSIEVNGGAAINLITFRQPWLGREYIVTIKPFIAPVVDIGIYISPAVCVSVYESLMMILFDNTTYLGSSTGLKIEYHF
ncbi:hypothetical protein ES703_125794 [subsurface metagenome]